MGLKRNAPMTSNSDHAIRLRVQPHAGQGRPVSVLMAQGGQGKDQCAMDHPPASISPKSANTTTGLEVIPLRGNEFALC